MKRLPLLARLLLFLVALTFFAPTTLSAKQSGKIAERYTKVLHRIPMRDGKTLHTTIYAPRDKSKTYPILINRTPYSTAPYHPMAYPTAVGPSKFMEDEGYIFVRQDVRGRWMSEGNYDNMRPHVPGDQRIDESSDTYDTIEWLLKNVEGHNGKVGIWGISYPGFYSAAALPEHHPALVAASPQAPISDFFFDDFHHNGAYLLSYFKATHTFGFQHDGPTANKWYPELAPFSQDDWTFYLNLGPLSNADQFMGQDNEFWKQLVEHPNYDEFWQKRSILPHLKDIKTNVLTVGGWFDAEDLYGPLNIYQTIEKNNPETFNVLVMGPWSHGDWSRRNKPVQVIGKIAFGERLSEAYQRDIEAPFFRHFLKGIGDKPKYEAMMFDTGTKKWDMFAKWPPAKVQPQKWYLHGNKQLASNPPADDSTEFTQFVSDPSNPVPYRQRQDIKINFTPRPYMTDDQRFASARKDVLVFQTPPLPEAVTLSGEILANLNVATTGTAADWIVKLIDVYPDNHPWVNGTPQGTQLGGFQQMVRSEVIRGRFRNSFEKPEPFVANEVTMVKLPLQDVHHTFKPGHRIMIHVQSTWFPLIDRNPQKYVDNIFRAKAEDFITATHRVYHSKEQPSWIDVKVLGK